uniref:Uncharacterized protein n=1 Tax=Siphoviridae sp. ctK0l2 TaxID=2826243 RepID=A0A8S5NK91_9CAUD|nr:MAG TPA: hypothetical protein [Siphoviridae sp. ctK0l2]
MSKLSNILPPELCIYNTISHRGVQVKISLFSKVQIIQVKEIHIALRALLYTVLSVLYS